MNVTFGGTPQGDAFARIAQQVRGDEKWYHCDWRRLLEWKTAYVAVACLSFVLLAIFGIVSIVVTDECIVDEPHGRCCECLVVNSTRMVGQTMTYEKGLNSVFYGVVMIINSCFGFHYVIVGVRTENKYQLFCMLATQLLEVLRALFDTWFETNPALKDRKAAREFLAYSSLVLLVCSAVLVRPLYKQFGWSIFRKGGVLKPVREAYKGYQMFRAFNRLDVQSSTLLFIIFGMYLAMLQGANWWSFLVVLGCDVLASRWLVKYIKHENNIGFYVSFAAKAYVVIWWVVLCVEFVECRRRYWDSLIDTRPYWDMNPYPDLVSVRATYNGVKCLAPMTRHDDRTLELIFLNLAQALAFRLMSMIYGVAVARRFGTGLKQVFYRMLTLATTVEADRPPESGTAIKFVPKKKKSAKAADESETELRTDAHMGSPAGAAADPGDDGEPASEYREYEAGSPRSDEDQGVTDEELREDLGW